MLRALLPGVSVMGAPQSPSSTGQKLDSHQKVFVLVQEVPKGLHDLLRLPGLLKASAAGATGPLGMRGEEEEEPSQSLPRSENRLHRKSRRKLCGVSSRSKILLVCVVGSFPLLIPQGEPA